MKNYSRSNYLKSFIEFNSLTGNKSNMFCINKNESKEHRNKKFEICCELIDNGFEAFTEVIFKDKSRADIVCFDNKGNGKIIEIAKSEKEKSIKNKLNKYNIEFDLEFIKR